jgi:hypothetical protein
VNILADRAKARNIKTSAHASNLRQWLHLL